VINMATKSDSLAGRTIAITRAAEQAGPLVERLEALGAVVIEVPAIAIVEPVDGGAELRGAAASFYSYEWVVFTSPNGAQRFLELVAPMDAASTKPVPKIAVVGPGTAEIVRAHGFDVTLMPERTDGEGLARMFPPGKGTALLPRAEQARRIVPDAINALGWQLDEVVAYRTVAAVPSLELLDAALNANAIAFTSSSTVVSFCDAIAAAVGPVTQWPKIVSIGPETSTTVRAKKLPLNAMASPHTIEGLVDAIVRVLTPAR
jgi:uroporphyrinogen-III synthase